MTIQETIEFLEKKKRHDPYSREEYDTAIESCRKQISRKIEIWNGQCMCPECNGLYGNYTTMKTLLTWEMPYCKWCGQKLDWSV